MKYEAEIEFLTKDPIDFEKWYHKTIDGRDGASVEFLGIVRGEEEGQPINGLDYEAYVPMAERLIAALLSEVEKRWPLHQIFVRHRIGRIAVGEVSMMIGVQAPHREEAFDACRFLIDAIKKDVPIWKKPYVNRTNLSERKSLVQRA